MRKFEIGGTLKIVMVSWRDIYHPKAGGAEEYTDSLLTQFALMGHEVILVSSKVPSRPRAEIRNGYSIKRAGNSLFIYWNAAKWINRYESDADLIIEQVNTIPFKLSRKVDSKNHGALIFQSCEDIWPYLAPWPISTIARRWIEPKWMREFQDTPTVTLCDSTKSDLNRFGLEKVAVVPPGRDPIQSASSKKYSLPTIVHVGRLVTYKRVDDLLKSLGPVHSKYPDLQVIVIGDGDDLPRLRRIAPEYVQFLGRVDKSEKDEIVSSSHLHVTTSVREGWGLVVTEAANLGTPNLSYDVSGLRDSTRLSGGWICPPDPDALARWLPTTLEMAMNGETNTQAPEFGLFDWEVVARNCILVWLGNIE